MVIAILRNEIVHTTTMTVKFSLVQHVNDLKFN